MPSNKLFISSIEDTTIARTNTFELGSVKGKVRAINLYYDYHKKFKYIIRIKNNYNISMYSISSIMDHFNVSFFGPVPGTIYYCGHDSGEYKVLY